MITKYDDDELLIKIIEIARERKPHDVRELCNIVEKELSVEESRIISAIIKLHDQSKLKLWDQLLEPSPSLIQYLKTNYSRWYWLSLIITLVAVISTMAISEDSYPLVYIRYILGVFFALWLPGYAFTRALYSVKSSARAPSDDLSFVERTALSLGMSITLVSIVGILLNFSPFGVRSTPLILILLALTLIFATIALLKEFRGQKRS